MIQQPIDLFISAANKLFGPITMLRKSSNQQNVQHIPWSAFQLNKTDWDRIRDVRDILSVCTIIYVHCSQLQLFMFIQ